MAYAVFDRVFETSTSTGTGTMSMAGAATGYRAFSSVYSTGDTLPYVIEAVDGSGNPTGDWEAGIGTYSAASTLTRTTVTASSNSGSVVTLAAGTKNVYVGMVAAKLLSALATQVFGTQTAAQPILDQAVTWNSGAVTFTGWKLNATDTASASASLLMDLQVGGTSKWNVDKSGKMLFGVSGVLYSSGTTWFGAGGTLFGFDANGLTFDVNGDTNLIKDATGILAQRAGVTSQAFRVYKTFTDSSNYERAIVGWNSGSFKIQTEGSGTGANYRDISVTAGQSGGATLYLGSGGASKVGISFNDVWAAPGDGTVSLGKTSYGFKLIYLRSGTLTASAPAADIAQTWNSGGVTFTGALVNITDTASAAASMLLDLQVGGTSKLNVTKAGAVVSAGYVKTLSTTVASLPSASTAGAGARAFVTDANATTYLSTVASGGSNAVPVVSDGTNWKIG